MKLIGIQKDEMKDIVVDLSKMPDDFFKTIYERMFDFIKKNDGVTLTQIAREFKSPETNVRRFLQFQLDQGSMIKEKCKCGQGNLFTVKK